MTNQQKIKAVHREAIKIDPKEEREAWDHYMMAAFPVVNKENIVARSACFADAMLDERRKRFGKAE